MNLPNVISLARLLVAPVIVWLLLTGALGAAFWVFLLAAASDAADGLIAKRFGSATVLGSYLDPIADKTLLVSVYIVLGSLGHLPLWLVLLVVSRDILIVGGALLLWLYARSFRMKPLMVSKVNTVAQITLAAVVLGALGLDVGAGFAGALGDLMTVLVYVVGATTMISGARYLVGWMRSIARVEIEE